MSHSTPEIVPPAEAPAKDAAEPPTGALRRQVFGLLVGAVFAPALVLAVLQVYFEYRQVERQQHDRLRLAVRLTATSIDQFVQTHASAIGLAANTASTYGAAPDLPGIRSLFPAFLTALTADSTGRITAVEPAYRAPGGIGRTVADRDYFRVHATVNRPYVSNGFVGRGLGSDPLVAVSAPILSQGEFRGIVEGSIKVDEFTALRSSALRSRGQEMLVIDREERVIYASAGLPFKFQQSVANASFLEGVEHEGASRAVLDKASIPTGSAWVSWARLHSGWRVVVFEPRREALAGIWRHAAQTAAVLLLVTLLVMIVAHLQIRNIARAANTTLDNLRAIAAGERRPGAPLNDVPAELKPVAEQVVQLAERLKQANADLSDALASEAVLTANLKQTNEQLEQTVQQRTAELEAANGELKLLSQTDALTGALNVRGLDACYAEATDAGGRLRYPVAIVMFDVDYFKAFNDRYGHPAGDQVLRRVAAIALAALRGEHDRLARVGGEEFLLFLPHTPASAAIQIAERVRQDLYELGMPHADATDARVTVSLGVARGEEGERLDRLLQRADEALYAAKENGRNCWAEWEPRLA